MKKIYQLLIVIGLLLIITFSGQAANDYPMRVTDDLNRELTIKDEPQRIVSLAPSVTEILYKLNLEDKIVGVTKFCNYPPQAQSKTKISAKNVESIITQEPDLVIAAGIISKKVIQRLHDLNIKIVGYQSTSINETMNTIKQIAKISGRKNKGQKLTTQMRMELRKIKSKVEQQLKKEGERATVFYEIWRQPLRTVGSGTFINDLITTAGGKNIAASTQGNWPQYSLEQLLLKNPEVYIATTGSWKDKVTADKIKERPNYKQLQAVKNDRVYVFNADIINRPGPRLIKGLKLFVESIYPQIRLAD